MKRKIEKIDETTIGDLEEEYRVDFRRRSDMRLRNYLKEEGYDSLAKAVKILEKSHKVPAS